MKHEKRAEKMPGNLGGKLLWMKKLQNYLKNEKTV